MSIPTSLFKFKIYFKSSTYIGTLTRAHTQMHRHACTHTLYYIATYRLLMISHACQTQLTTVVFVYIVLDRPNSEEFSQYIKPWCDSMWFDLGVLLDVPLHTLKHIKLSGSEDCCMQMFIEWLNCNSDGTWDHLLKAVNSVLFGTLSDLINAYHGKST